MASFATGLFVGGGSESRHGPIAFPEPDWPGDSDYNAAASEPEVDDLVAALAQAIAKGRTAGRLDDYTARRAAFDLQSIRGQIVRERQGRSNAIAPNRLCAICSRLARLSACLESAGGVGPDL